MKMINQDLYIIWPLLMSLHYFLKFFFFLIERINFHQPFMLDQPNSIGVCLFKLEHWHQRLHQL